MRYTMIPAMILAISPTIVPLSATAQSNRYTYGSPFKSNPAEPPVTIPLAPVLDPNFKEKNQTVTYVTEGAAPQAGWQVAEVLKGQPMSRSFSDAVTRTGLDKQLNTDRGFTAFVPVVAGHSSSDIVRPIDLSNATAADLSKSVVNDRINIALIDGTGADFHAVDGSRVRITKMGDSVRVNGMRVVKSLKTPQGFVYYINVPVQG